MGEVVLGVIDWPSLHKEHSVMACQGLRLMGSFLLPDGNKDRDPHSFMAQLPQIPPPRGSKNSAKREVERASGNGRHQRNKKAVYTQQD